MQTHKCVHMSFNETISTNISSHECFYYVQELEVSEIVAQQSLFRMRKREFCGPISSNRL